MKRKLAWFLAAMMILVLPVHAQEPPAQLADPEFSWSTAAQDGFVYTSIRGPLERVSLATQQRATVAPASPAYDLTAFTVSGGRVYWCGAGALYSCKGDGSGLVKIATGAGTPSNLRVEGKWLYYLPDGGSPSPIWRVGTDGSGKEQVVDEAVERFELSRSFLYYDVGDGSLYRCAPDGQGTITAGEIGDEWLPRIIDGVLYYKNDAGWNFAAKNGRIKDCAQPQGFPARVQVDRVPTEARPDMSSGMGKMTYTAYGTRVWNPVAKADFTLPDSAPYSWLGSESHFYFTQTKEDPGFYRVGWDGKGKEKLAQSGEAILLTDGYVVYRAGNDIALVKD